MSNKILAFFCRLIRFYFTIVYTEVCVSKPLWELMRFQCNNYFENATIVTFAGLRVKEQVVLKLTLR